MKTELEIGDKIKRFEVMLSVEINYIYTIDSVTKTLGKSKDDKFKKEIIFNTTKPDDRFIGEVRCINGSKYHRYFVLI